MEQTKIGRNSTPGERQIPAQYCISTPRIHSEARCGLRPGGVSPCEGVWSGHKTRGMQGLIPRPSTPPVFDRLQYAKCFKADSVEGLGKRLGMQLYSL